MIIACILELLCKYEHTAQVEGQLEVSCSEATQQEMTVTNTEGLPPPNPCMSMAVS